MKTLITGANGFLGSHLVDRLLERKDEVHVLVRRQSNLRWLLGKQVHYHYGDVVDQGGRGFKDLREGVQGADAVYHLAGVIRAIRRKTYYEVNARGTENVLEACLEANPRPKRVVVVTSLAAHGPGVGDRPIREEDGCHPITDYGRSKRDAELITLRYADKLPVTIVRPPAIYGPRDDQVLNVFKMARRGVILIPGGGRRIINLAHVQDVVSGILLASDRPGAVGEIFFIGEDQNYDWLEVADMVARAVRRPKPFKIRVPRPLVYGAAGVAELVGRLMGRPFSLNLAYARNFLQKNWALDVSKAQKLLGYRSGYPLMKGAEETATWYQNEGWL